MKKIMLSLFLLMATAIVSNAQITKTVPSADSITIAAGTDSATIASSKSLFKEYVDPDFFDLPINKTSDATKQTTVQVSELKEMVNFSQLFNSFGKSLDKLCLTQGQIVKFCKANAALLSKPSDIGGSETFFLFKAKGTYYVAGVNASPKGLSVLMHQFTETGLLIPQLGHRVVIPN